MPKASIGLPAAIQDYLVTYGTRESAVQRALRALTDQQPAALKCSSTEQMQLLGLLCKLLGAAHVIEVGVFTGYGTLALAMALPPHGRVVAFDIREQYPALGRPYWEHAGVAEKIELRIGPAREGLRQLVQERLWATVSPIKDKPVSEKFATELTNSDFTFFWSRRPMG